MTVQKINIPELPTISITMISLNDERILDDCLSSIKSQNYPQHLIQIILVDGGSSDHTLSIAKKYNAEVISRPDLINFPNIRSGISMTLAKSDLVMFLSADNRLQENDILSLMVQALADEDVVACETMKYGYRVADPILSRYFALIGGIDPIAVGLGKADRKAHDSNQWTGLGIAKDCNFFYKVTFPPDSAKIPTIGANGFLIKRKFLEKSNLAQAAFHIDMCVELIMQGHDKFAFIKDRHIVHFIDVTLISFIKRRLLFANMYESTKESKRIYSVFDKKDLLKLIVLIFFNITILVPLLRAIKGYLTKRDIAWFIHPLISLSFTLSYSFYFIKKFFKQL